MSTTPSRVREEEDDENDRNVRARLDAEDSEELNADQEEEEGDDDDDEEEVGEEVDEEEDSSIREEYVTYVNNGGTYTFHLTLSKYYGCEEAREVNVTLFFRKEGESESASERGRKVGYLQGYLLPRPSQFFHEIADAISEELQELSCMFCDSRGHATRIRSVQEDLGGPGSRGVKRGGFLQIYSVEVGGGHQGKCDLGLRLVHATLVFLRKEWNLACMVSCLLGVHNQQWPDENDRLDIRHAPPEGPFTEQQETGLKEANLNIKRHFARMGFKQAGRNPDQHHCWYITSTTYFTSPDEDSDAAITRWKSKQEARTTDVYEAPEKHVPRGLDKDLNELVGKIQEDSSADRINAAVLSIEALVQRGASIHGARAMHVAAASSLESTAILRTLVRLGGDVNAPDENGSRPLHIAASCIRPAAITFLLGVGADRDSRDGKDETALQSLQVSVQDADDFAQCMGMTCYLPLKSRLDATLALMTEDELSLLADGWLSPRMKKMLLITSELIGDLINYDSATFQNHKAKPLSECCSTFGIGKMPMIEYIPPEILRQNPDGFYKSFNDGWGMIFQAMAEILRRNQSPTIERVRDQVQVPIKLLWDVRKYRHFVEKGGKIEFALNALFASTRNVLADGDGYWEYDEYKDEIEALPATPLDREFDICRVKCFGITEEDRPTCVGPFHHSYDDE